MSTCNRAVDGTIVPASIGRLSGEEKCVGDWARQVFFGVFSSNTYVAVSASREWVRLPVVVVRLPKKLL